MPNRNVIKEIFMEKPAAGAARFLNLSEKIKLYHMSNHYEEALKCLSSRLKSSSFICFIYSLEIVVVLKWGQVSQAPFKALLVNPRAS